MSEPATWLVTASDSTAGLQVAGGNGLSLYLSSGSTVTPVVASTDQLTYLRVGTTPTPSHHDNDDDDCGTDDPTTTAGRARRRLRSSRRRLRSSDDDCGRADDDCGRPDDDCGRRHDDDCGSDRRRRRPTDDHCGERRRRRPRRLTSDHNDRADDDDCGANYDDDGAAAAGVGDGFVLADAGERLGMSDSGLAWTLQGTAANFVCPQVSDRSRSRTGQTRGATVATLQRSMRRCSRMWRCPGWDRVGHACVAVGSQLLVSGSYRVKLQFGFTGAATAHSRLGSLGARRRCSRSTPVAGLTYQAGQRLSVRFDYVGTAPTVLRARVWLAGTSEPATWLVTAMDSTAVLQTAGGNGLSLYLSSASTVTPVVASTDRTDDHVTSVTARSVGGSGGRRRPAGRGSARLHLGAGAVT